MLSVSSENVDRVGRRERFMKSNFESLSGNGPAGVPAPIEQQPPAAVNNSISNQFREGGASALQRNAVTIARYSLRKKNGTLSKIDH